MSPGVQLTLTDPAMLWALLGLPLLLLARWLSGRPQATPVASLQLWSQLQGRAAARARQRRLHRLQLILEAATLIGLVLAAAGPQLHRDAPPIRRLALVIDDAPALATAHADGQTAWARARAAADAILARLSPRDRVALRWVNGSGTPAPLWTDPSDARRRVANASLPARATGAATPIVAAALALGADVVVVQIGLGPPRTPVDPRRLPIGVGPGDTDNAGWLTLEAGPEPGSPGQIQLRAQLGSASRHVRALAVRVDLDGQPRLRRRLTVPAGGRAVLRATLAGPAERIEVVLEGGDRLALDDRLAARRVPPVRVDVTGGDPGALAEVWPLLPEVDPDAPADRRLRIALGPPPESSDDGPLVIASSAAGGPWAATPSASAPVGFGRRRADPLLDGLDLSRVRIGRAATWTIAPADRVTLAWSSAGDRPLIAHSPGLLALAFAPGPPDSDWPADPTYPVFWRRVVRHFFPDAGRYRLTAPAAGPQVTCARGWTADRLPTLPAVVRGTLTRQSLRPGLAAATALIMLVYAATCGTRAGPRAADRPQ